MASKDFTFEFSNTEFRDSQELPSGLAAKFSSPKYSKEDQIAEPEKARTRLIKDMIGPGSYSVTDRVTGKRSMWTPGRDDIETILKDTRRYLGSGYQVHLTNGHPESSTGEIFQDDIVATIDEVVEHEGTIWFSTYVSQKRATDLQNTRMTTSPGIRSYQDGKGQTYRRLTHHIALTGTPVIPNQSTWLALSNQQETKVMDLETALKMIGGALPEGESLPEELTEDALQAAIDKIKSAGSAVPGGNDASENSGADLSNQAPAWATKLFGGFDKRFDAIESKIKDSEQSEKRKRFEAHLSNLSKDGTITTEKHDFWLERGEAIDWNTDFLPESKPGSSVDMSNVSSGSGSTESPSLPGGSGERTDADIAKSIGEDASILADLG